MHKNSKSVLLVSMPYASLDIPSIQLSILEGYLKERDITVETSHLYLKAADFYEVKNYNYLIFPPNDSYTAQMVFSKYVFPDHWKSYRNFFKKYYNDSLLKNRTVFQPFSFEQYVKETDEFFKWALKNTNWQHYDIIGFTLNYGQFLPSLAVAKQIKNKYPEKEIVFGGSRTTGILGVRVLTSFNFIDYIVSGDGEEALYELAAHHENIDAIPGLIYRKNEEITWNKSCNTIDLNNNPFPSFDSFYSDLSTSSLPVQQFFNYYGRLPLEVSRGCWWNRCTFCNLNLQYPKYREKDTERIIQEIELLSQKYKILTFQIIGNTLPKHNLQNLLQHIINLKKDFTFYAEARADQLKRDDYTLLKKAGFSTIQTGIESFSQNYLKKINKGIHIINNIAALKYCKENEIKNQYNLIIEYPNEEVKDFDESKTNIDQIMQYLDPPTLCRLRVVFNSPIYQNPEQFNIKKLVSSKIDKIMFPREILDKQFNFVFDYSLKENIPKNRWHQLIQEWQENRTTYLTKNINTQMTLEKLIFYYVDGGSFLKIYDKRKSDDIKIYDLNEKERDVFLLCLDIISFQDLQNKIHIDSQELKHILVDFEDNGIIFRENDRYLSLPLSYSISLGSFSKNEHVYSISLPRQEIVF